MSEPDHNTSDDFVLVKRSAVDWLQSRYPTLCIRAGLSEQVGNRLRTIAPGVMPTATAGDEPSPQTDGDGPDLDPELDPATNPFLASRYDDRQLYHVTAEDRTRALRDATERQLAYVLTLPDLQKTVRQAAERRLRQLQSGASA